MAYIPMVGPGGGSVKKTNDNKVLMSTLTYSIGSISNNAVMFLRDPNNTKCTRIEFTAPCDMEIHAGFNEQQNYANQFSIPINIRFLVYIDGTDTIHRVYGKKIVGKTYTISCWASLIFRAAKGEVVKIVADLINPDTGEQQTYPFSNPGDIYMYSSCYYIPL